MIDSLHIGLASPEEVRQWAGGEGDGRVSNSKTVDYKSLTPVKDGLFCERIFGAAKSDRRRKLGYIELASPVVHGWYLKDRTGYLAILLGKKRRGFGR